jgi:methylenetetrahydrofolate dehydrogenase (NADP+)/methenyltetrahydrofolate cyclohydrolase
MQLLDGKIVSTKIKDEIKEEILQLGIEPCLAIIRVGDDPASKVYVNNKIKNCEYTGIKSINIILSEDTTQEKLIKEIQTLNENKDINGILVQLPLPKHIDKDIVINTVNPNKDVDCFHPENIGKLFVGNPIFKPCTPWGVIELLKYYNIPIAGQHCVIIGRSDIVGKPMAHLMLQENATVTIAHSQTKDLAFITETADIIISAVGKAKFVKGNMVGEEAVVVDVGINRDENGKLCGDVDFNNVQLVAAAISPVPGGCGVMTTTMLMANTLKAYKIQNNL